MKSIVKRLMGEDRYAVLKRWRQGRKIDAQVTGNYAYDSGRFKSSASIFLPPYDAEMLAARIMMDCHRIEKGLALADPRPGFGQDVVQRLIELVPEHERLCGPDFVTRASRKALHEYRAFNAQAGVASIPQLDAFLDAGPEAASCEAGTMEVQKDDIQRAGAINFDAFARNRYSVRQFTGEPVPMEAIEAATSTALKSPSVCNRQSGRVHVALSRDQIAKALSFQNGNRGFGDQAGAVLIITSDMRSFIAIGERNQCWVDGGLFAMSLCYALHGLGFGTCMLNWSMTADQDRAMRNAIGIPDHEAVITMMAVGHLRETFKVAVSPRRDLSTVIKVVK